MCGIAGVLGPNGEGAVRAMCAALRHRGPDDEGFHSDECATLGMRRLSILDLSASGHQPMCNEDGTVWLVYNGEIYNFRDLAAWLRERGHAVRSTGDAEVLLHLYEEEGPGFLPRLNGMFAFAIWDSRRRRVLLARDRLGIKPLYYRLDGETLAYASEIKALTSAGLAPRRLDPGSLGAFLFSGSVPGPETIVEGVRALPPGSTLVCEPGRPPVEERFWRLRFEEERGLTAAAAREHVKEVLTSAVVDHLVSDVDVGVFLSGGIDSTLVATIAARHLPGINSYSIGYEEAGERFDETSAAAKTAAALGTRHHSVSLGVADAARALPGFIEAMDQPTHDGLNVYLVSALAAHHAKVVLSGLGGDELFAGYSTFKFASMVGRLRSRAPWLSRLGPAASSLDRSMPPGIRAQWPWRVAAGVLGAHQDQVGQYWVVRDFFSPAECSALLEGSGLAEAGALRVSEVMARQDALLAEARPLGVIPSQLALELRGYMRDTLLADADAMSMAHSLELRVPFLVPRLLDTVTRLPAALLAPEAYLGKRLLVEAFADLLPSEVREGRKRGFALPLPIWMRQPQIREVIEDCLSATSVSRRGLLAPAAVRRQMDAFYARDHRRGNQGQLWLRVWMLAVLELWCRTHLDSVRAPAAAGLAS